jgi:hypothetical protein
VAGGLQNGQDLGADVVQSAMPFNTPPMDNAARRKTMGNKALNLTMRIPPDVKVLQ